MPSLGVRSPWSKLLFTQLKPNKLNHCFESPGLLKGQIKSEWIDEIINFQKMTPKIWRIQPWEFLLYISRAEILQIFGSFFGKFDDFINPFWVKLTCSMTVLKQSKNYPSYNVFWKKKCFKILDNIWENWAKLKGMQGRRCTFWDNKSPKETEN